MAATFGRLTIILTLWLVAVGPLCASEDMSGLSRDAVEISYSAFDRSKSELEAVIERCDKNREPVSSTVLSSLGLSQQQLKTALFVLNSRAEAGCEGGAREKLFFTASAHVAVAGHYRIDAKDAVDYAGDLLFVRQWQRMEYEAAYLRLDARIREKLEAIDAMKVPFDIFRTLDALAEEK
jgi:predicted alpha/beta hydrolase